MNIRLLPLPFVRLVNEQICTATAVGVIFMRKISTQMLTRMALLIALNVVLSRVASIRIPLGGVEGFRFGFGSLPVIFAGVFMGPLAGGIVGALGDFCGYFINPVGAYMPLFTVNAALRGVIPGVAVILFCKTKKQIGVIPLFLIVCCTFILTEIFLLPYLLELLFGLSRVITLPPRIIQSAVSAPVYTAILFSLTKKMHS